MKRISSDKYTVAWFKLSECIARGEKERALGMYRLLAHSLDNAAFSKQLEGDILLFFNDTIAHDKYREAVKIYLEQGRFLEAAMIYEHLLSIGIKPSDNYLMELIEWYSRLQVHDKVKQYATQSINELSKQHNWQGLLKNIELLSAYGDSSLIFDFRQGIIESAIIYNAPEEIVMNFIYDFLTALVAVNDVYSMQRLLSFLYTTHTEYYEKASIYINK